MVQAAEIETLKKEKVQMSEEKDGLMICSQKLADEGSYAKELAAAAAVELRNLAAEVTKLSYHNAKLNADLAATKEALSQRSTSFHSRKNIDTCVRKPEEGNGNGNGMLIEELQQELNARHQREASLIGALSERDKLEIELRKRLDAAKRHEEDLETELAKMWGLVANLQKSHTCEPKDILSKNNKVIEDNVFSGLDETRSLDLDELRVLYHKETQRCRELDTYVSRLKVHTFTCFFFPSDNAVFLH